jgi:uncharacterized protein YdbL (DUF1318 family)
VKTGVARAAALALLVGASPVVAQTPAVDAARAAGSVGERFDGYLGIAAAVPGPVRSQVASINIQRRTLYTNLAASKGVSPNEVGITAGCELLGRVRVGEAYMLADGAWRHRAPGHGVTKPAYCR